MTFLFHFLFLKNNSNNKNIKVNSNDNNENIAAKYKGGNKTEIYLNHELIKCNRHLKVFPRIAENKDLSAVFSSEKRKSSSALNYCDIDLEAYKKAINQKEDLIYQNIEVNNIQVGSSLSRNTLERKNDSAKTADDKLISSSNPGANKKLAFNFAAENAKKNKEESKEIKNKHTSNTQENTKKNDLNCKFLFNNIQNNLFNLVFKCICMYFIYLCI